MMIAAGGITKTDVVTQGVNSIIDAPIVGDGVMDTLIKESG